MKRNKKKPSKPISSCPECGNGTHGQDALCDKHWSEYLGQHIGGR